MTWEKRQVTRTARDRPWQVVRWHAKGGGKKPERCLRTEKGRASPSREALPCFLVTGTVSESHASMHMRQLVKIIKRHCALLNAILAVASWVGGCKCPDQASGTCWLRKGRIEAHRLAVLDIPREICTPPYRDLRSRVTSGEIDPSLVERYLYPFVANSPEIPNGPTPWFLSPWVEQLRVSALFSPRGQWVIIPPQYRRNQEVSVAEFLGRILEPLGLGAVKAEIPLKLAAARSFLGEYGRNNLFIRKKTEVSCDWLLFTQPGLWGGLCGERSP